MYRKDYFLKLVQQFTKVLTRLLGLKESGDLLKASEVIQEAYHTLFDVEREYLLTLSSVDIAEKLINENKLNEEQVELLAKLFIEDGEIDLKHKTDFHTKALSIFEYLNQKQKLYSFEREALIKKLQNELN
jgi:hypothetical protein